MEAKVLENTTFAECRNLENRPIEINWSDGGGSQRINPRETFYVDENRLANDTLANKQFESYIESKTIRVLRRNTSL